MEKHTNPFIKQEFFEIGNKFPLGQKCNKKHKYVETTKGTNLFFAVYGSEETDKKTGKKMKKRIFETFPLNVIVERQKQVLGSVPEKNEKGYSICHECPFLSPNDLVYVPSTEEQENLSSIDINNLTNEQIKRIYKTVIFSGTKCFFIKQDVAISIMNKAEFSSLNIMEKSIDEIMIKDVCIKLKVDRLGNISKA